MCGINEQKYSADAHIAEIYDNTQTQTDDVEFFRRLIGTDRVCRIFEPFCGTGRIALPLARDGHRVHGLDCSEPMLERFRTKLACEPPDVQSRVCLTRAPVFGDVWPADQDVVLLAGNCPYELSSSDEQRALIHRAACYLRPGGHVLIDCDDHHSAELSPQWRRPPGQQRRAFPSGECADGTRLEATTEVEWYDARFRLVHYVRRLRVTKPDGTVSQHQWRETCRPVVMTELLAWVEEAGLEAEATFGGAPGNPYTSDSTRATVWARKC
jgi:SAM-dependent methyltransferase